MANFGYPLTASLTSEDLWRYAPRQHGTETMQPEYYAGGEQQLPNPYSAQLRGLGATAVGAAGTAGLFAATRATGRNPWNYVHAGLRLAEDYSPGQIFRTFQLGNITSQYADVGLAAQSITAKEIEKLTDTPWLKDLMNRTGPKGAQAFSHGLQFEGGQLKAGSTVLFEHARKMVTTGEPHIVLAHARNAGSPGLGEVGVAKSFTKPIHEMFDQNFSFIGASTRKGLLGKQISGFMTESVTGRVNRLAAAPFELEPLKTIAGKTGDIFENVLGRRPKIAVEAGAMFPTLGRMAAKWGGTGTAAYLGYKTADWAVRNFSLLDNTPFDEGITAGIATAGVQLNLAAARTADFLPGVRGYQELQEEIAPGSTSLTKLAAFPLMGALGGMTATYAIGSWDRTKFIRQNLKQGMEMSAALTKADSMVIEEAEKFSKNSFLGRKITKHFGETRVPLLGSLSKTKLWSVYGAALAGALALPFLPGALIPENTGDELEAIYSGEKEVAIRKGRWWELGRTPYEGTSIEYFRPHWYPRMLQGSRTKSLYGDDEPTPIGEWFRENFTYGPEGDHYYDRPYPMTGTAFEDVPIIGPVLGATLGRLVKPPKLMHTEEWLTGGAEAANSRNALGSINRDYTENRPVKRIQERYGENLRFELGETPKGSPMDPGDPRQVFGEQAYRMTELAGLVGFSFSSLKGMITGEEEFFGQEERLQTARRSYGAEREYWDLSIGGGLGTTEFFRRLYPHRRRQIQEYNPIRNTMPDWMPGPGQKSPDFLHGDPFIKIKEGELRLPGRGYAARFPELEGVNPEDYPAIYRYKILSDIAPYSDQFDRAENAAEAALMRGTLTEKQVRIFQQIKEQTKERNDSKNNFFEYQILSNQTDMAVPGVNQSSGILSLVNENLRSKEKKRGVASSVIGGYWEGLIAGAQNPIEALSPLAPASKLISLETATEKYKRTQVYGPDVAFWQKPVENFVLPFMRESADVFGIEGIPTKVARKRQISEYFDILKYVKGKRLANVSREEGLDPSTTSAYERSARETITGVNPYTKNYSTLFRALPHSERNYFTAFAQAKTNNERQTILNMIPASERRIYKAQWELGYVDQIKEMLGTEQVPSNLRGQAITDVARILDKQESEGFPITPGLVEQYQSGRTDEESYADWFRRSVLIPQATAEMGGLPGPDWVGWHPGVDLDNIKLKVAKSEGMDIHDFNLWEADERAVAQKGYLDEAAHELEEIQGIAPSKSAAEVERELRALMSDLGIVGTVHVSSLASSQQSYTITVDASEDRRQELRQELHEAGL